MSDLFFGIFWFLSLMSQQLCRTHNCTTASDAIHALNACHVTASTPEPQHQQGSYPRSLFVSMLHNTSQTHSVLLQSQVESPVSVTPATFVHRVRATFDMCAVLPDQAL